MIDPAVAHEQLTLRPCGDRGVVRDDDYRGAVGVHAIEQRPRSARRLRDQLARGLVGEQEPRPIRQRARDRDALRLAAGQLRRADDRRGARVRRSRAAPASARRRSLRDTPASACGTSTFSQRVSIGSRKKRWKTKPMLESERGCARVGQGRYARPSKSSVPLVGVSTQPRMCSSVDLPQPDGPRIARYSPARSSATRRAGRRTGPAGIGNVLVERARRRSTAAHDTTSFLSVVAIGSRATSHIGYTAAKTAVSGEERPCSTSARGSKTKKCSAAGMPGHRLQYAVQPPRQARSRGAAPAGRRVRRAEPIATACPPRHVRRENPSARSAAISPRRWLTDTVRRTVISRNPKTIVIVDSTVKSGESR